MPSANVKFGNELYPGRIVRRSSVGWWAGAKVDVAATEGKRELFPEQDGDEVVMR